MLSLQPNFIGSTVSGMASELSRSLGLTGSINNGETGRCMAQAPHGSAPDLVGKILRILLL